MSRILLWPSCCVLLGLVGCEARPTPNPASSSPHAVPTQAEAPAEQAAPGQLADVSESVSTSREITVSMIDADGFAAAVAKHKGKVVLVDCWATWCVPCIKAFPGTVALSRKHAEDGLVVMSLSFDDPEDEETPAKVLGFLKSQEATIENYISQVDLEQGGAEAFEIDGGSVPHYKLYDRTGKLVKTFSNSDPDQEFSHEMLVSAVEDALK